jgi:hypothetical protein
VIGSTPDRLALRIATWLALAILIAIAFHYAKKYEAEMLTKSDHSNLDYRPQPGESHV